MPDALKATYVNLKTVMTRSTVQIILEMPIEAMPDIMSLLGPPASKESVWVGLARLNLDESGQPRKQAAANEDGRPPAKLAQIAGIACNEGGFWKFLAEKGDYTVTNADEAAEYVRLICGIRSRSELDTNVHAARVWRDLKSDYDVWLRDFAA